MPSPVREMRATARHPIRGSKSRTPPQVGAASHYIKEEDDSERRENSVSSAHRFEPKRAQQGAQAFVPTLHRSAAVIRRAPHGGRTTPPGDAARVRRGAPVVRRDPRKKAAHKHSQNGSRVEDPCRVPGQSPGPPEAPTPFTPSPSPRRGCIRACRRRPPRRPRRWGCEGCGRRQRSAWSGRR